MLRPAQVALWPRRLGEPKVDSHTVAFPTLLNPSVSQRDRTVADRSRQRPARAKRSWAIFQCSEAQRAQRHQLHGGGIQAAHPSLCTSAQRSALRTGYRHFCCTGRACSVFVPRRILDITHYVFISDPGNFQACMSVDAIPVLPPCGDKLKRGAAGPGNEDRETLRGHCLIGANSTSLNAAKPKPTPGFCLGRQMGSTSASAGQPSFSRPRSSSRSGERSLLLLFFFFDAFFFFFFFYLVTQQAETIYLQRIKLHARHARICTVRLGSAHIGSARLSSAHCCPYKNIWRGERGRGEV